MTLENYRLNQHWAHQCLQGLQNLIAEQKTSGDLDPFGQRGMFLDLLAQVHLRYTAGEPIEAVAIAFDEMFQWFCKWHMDFASYAVQLRLKFRSDAEPAMAPSSPTPLDFEDVEDFHRAITVVSLAVLLGKAESLRIAADLLHAERGQDMLLEDLLSQTVAARSTTEFYHVKPYDPLIDAYYLATSPDEARANIRKYLRDWYPAMKACAWHDSHLVQKDHMTPYNGYWSFEAGAICLIHGIDDTGFRDHMVYPKDLVDWARQNDSLGKLRAAAKVGLKERGPRCEGGQPCPREGLWFSPAQPDSGRRFKQGEQMPVLGGAWGLTIWQWEADR